MVPSQIAKVCELACNVYLSHTCLSSIEHTRDSGLHIESGRSEESKPEAEQGQTS